MTKEELKLLVRTYGIEVIAQAAMITSNHVYKLLVGARRITPRVAATLNSKFN